MKTSQSFRLLEATKRPGTGSQVSRPPRVKLLLGLVVVSMMPVWAGVIQDQTEDVPTLDLFFEAGAKKDADAKPALEQISRSWRDGYTAMILELIRHVRPEFRDVRRRLYRFLREQTGQSFGGDNVDATQLWLRWAWKLPYNPHPEYTSFKESLYGNIDPRMARFFPVGTPSLIRLDEVQWGGVRVNGIPPLDHPKNIPAGEASYLKDKHVVFGVSVDGEARAYPKRILAWHEMALDKLGGIEITLVYCTLCGSAIPYNSAVGGRHRTFGTSGLLYRSNKLMFDHESYSLWSTLLGKPVIGKLAGSDLQLESLPIVTTRWGEWRQQHPNTTVLSLDTGHQRDYREGQAYKEYFSRDELMFQVAETDDRLKNKAEILGILLESAATRGEEQALAISAKFLSKHPIFQIELAGYPLTVLTSPEGANRVFKTQDRRFDQLLEDGRVVDIKGQAWQITEGALVSENNPRLLLARVPAHRAFWFGWFAQFPETQLIK